MFTIFGAARTLTQEMMFLFGAFAVFMACIVALSVDVVRRNRRRIEAENRPIDTTIFQQRHDPSPLTQDAPSPLTQDDFGPPEQDEFDLPAQDEHGPAVAEEEAPVPDATAEASASEAAPPDLAAFLDGNSADAGAPPIDEPTEPAVAAWLPDEPAAEQILEEPVAEAAPAPDLIDEAALEPETAPPAPALEAISEPAIEAVPEPAIVADEPVLTLPPEPAESVADEAPLAEAPAEEPPLAELPAEHAPRAEFSMEELPVAELPVEDPALPEPEPAAWQQPLFAPETSAAPVEPPEPELLAEPDSLPEPLAEAAPPDFVAESGAEPEPEPAALPVLPVLVCEGYGAGFGGKVVLADIRLEILNQGITTLMGPVGTGKSTLLRALAGSLSQSGLFKEWGQASYRGAPLGPDNRPLLVAQRIQLIQRSALDNLLFHLRGRTAHLPEEAQRAWASQWLEQAGAGDLIALLDRPFMELGQLAQRIITILREAAAEPALLMIDEPATGLAEADAAVLLAMLERLAVFTPLLVVLQSHKHARKISSRIVLLAGGRVQAVCDAGSFFDDPPNAAAAQFAATGNCAVPAPDAAPAPPPVPEAEPVPAAEPVLAAEAAPELPPPLTADTLAAIKIEIRNALAAEMLPEPDPITADPAEPAEAFFEPAPEPEMAAPDAEPEPITAEPEAPVAEIIEPEPEPEMAAPEPEPVPEPITAEPEAPLAEIIEPEPEPEMAAPEPEPVPEPITAEPEAPVAEIIEPEPEMAAPEPEPEPEPITAEPEAPVAEIIEPEPEMAAPAPEPEPVPEPITAEPEAPLADIIEPEPEIILSRLAPQTHPGMQIIPLGPLPQRPGAGPAPLEPPLTQQLNERAAVTRYPGAGTGPRGFLWIEDGRLAATPMPGMAAAMEHDLDQLKMAGITVLITLTEQDVPQDMLVRHGLRNVHFPIADRKAPNTAETDLLVNQMHDMLNNGEVLAVHCLAGLGRTGTILAAYMVKEKGVSAQVALNQIRRFNRQFVQTDDQEDFLMEYEVQQEQTVLRNRAASGAKLLPGS